MCMTLPSRLHRIPRLSLKPITGYKVMRRTNNPNTCLSIFRNYTYHIGHPETSLIRFNVYGNIDIGLHTINNYEDAVYFIESLREREPYPLNANRCSEYGLFECTIPRFTKYYSGVWDSATHPQPIANRVSTTLTITKEIILESELEKLEIYKQMLKELQSMKHVMPEDEVVPLDDEFDVMG